ncbi:hypothetical protein ACSL9C_000762 [Vibrio navarrensis]
MSQELVNSVNKLTDETSALLQEYVKGNTVLQNSASDAASSAAAAKASETNSVNQANIATQKAAESKQYRDETAAIATGGTATVDPAPGKIPLANSQGKISSGWLTALAFARTKADMDAMRASVNRQCAASGMIHAGKAESVSLGIVNEGMWTVLDTAAPNMFLLGRGPNGNKHGQSETEYPVFNMAGFPVHLKGLPHEPGPSVDWVPFAAKFPQAPDGTDIYDSSGNCRGTGKPTLNLLTEVDPKYGDIAPNRNEAVARAFEGLVKNGDFRNGLNSWTVEANTNAVANPDGSVTITPSTTTQRYLYQNVGLTGEVDIEVVFKTNYTGHVTVPTDTGGIEFPCVAGKLTTYKKTTTNRTATLVPISTDGLDAPNRRVTIYYASIRPASEEVVTERVDLSGLEGYLEEITPAKPYIYPYGGINNQATSVDGIATTVDNVRPITYFANFTGDTTSRGRGWNLNNLTDAQLLTILHNPYHHVYVIDGRLVQFRFRPRQIKGAGNGDWSSINSVGNLPFRYSPRVDVAPQGMADSESESGSAWYAQFGSEYNYSPYLGVFTAPAGNKNTAYNGECYFYVLATVLRLNQGAYHPSLNPLGAARWVNSAANWDSDWSGLGTGFMADVSANAVKDCFVRKVSGQGGVAYGTINSGKTGRPDGRFYDAIYPDSVGGVIDRRLSAFPVTMEDYFKAMAKAENGSMRGMEKLVRTYIIEARGSNAIWCDPSSSTLDIAGNGKGPIIAGEYEIGGKVSFLSDSGFLLTGKCINNSVATHIKVDTIAGTPQYGLVEGVLVVEVTKDTNIRKDQSITEVKKGPNASVSGNFLQTDVVGDPANILQVDALKNGWMGSWIPQIPDGTSKKYLMTRKAQSNPTGVVTGWTVGTWAGWSPALSSVTNDFTAAIASNEVVVLNYTAAAKVTKPSAVLPVYGSKSGLGPVITTEHNAVINGALLAESLMGKVLTASGANTGLYAIPLSLLRLDPATGKLAGYDQPKHAAIPLAAPNNNSPAIKILPHAVSNNGQATLGFAWNEIKHNGANWGDDGTMRVIDNTGTYNNLNGQSCLYGYAELALPIGWVDNHARFGAQVPGVDL